MRRRAAIGAVVAVALALVGSGSAAAPATIEPGTLTVGIAMPSEGFQVGIVKGSEVVYAQGLEIDLARAVAARMGLRRTAFVQNRFDRLFSAGPKPFDVGIGEISITPARRSTVTFSVPYMSVDQGVLAAQSVDPVPTTTAGLKSLRVCALRKSTGAEVARKSIAPTSPVIEIGNVPSLMLDVQTGRCDVVVYDLPALATLKARAPDRYGPFVGLFRTRERYGIALPQGSPLAASVNTALRSLLADGSVDRLVKKWLTIDPSTLRVLR